MNDSTVNPASEAGPQNNNSARAGSSTQRRPFSAPTLEKVGELKDLTQLQFSGGG